MRSPSVTITFDSHGKKVHVELNYGVVNGTRFEARNSAAHDRTTKKRTADAEAPAVRLAASLEDHQSSIVRLLTANEAMPFATAAP